ncbi:MAG: glycosyltransferase family 2 protein [Synechococcus sp.]
MANPTAPLSENRAARAQYLVSVIIPAYNVAEYLTEAIESALNQSHDNVEVIIVDDCSQDATLELAQAFAKVDSRVKVIANPVNQGAAVARNLALDAASGDWIAIFDSDDWLSPERFDFLLQKAEESSADMMADDFGYVNDGDRQPWTTFVKRNGDVYSKGLTQIDKVFYVDSKNWTVSPGILKPLVRRAFIEEHGIRYKDELLLGEDFFFYLDCLIHGARFFVYPEVHYYYRVRPGSVTNSSSVKHAKFRIKGLKDVLGYKQLADEPELHHALLKKLDGFNKYLLTASVRELLGKKHYLTATAKAVRNPHFFVWLFEHIKKKLIVRAHRIASKITEQSSYISCS